MVGLKKRREEYKEIPLEKVVDPDGRIRLEIDEEEIKDLAHSIEAYGLRQAIEVIKRDDNFEIVYGERRVLAHRSLGLKTIWAKVVDLSKDEILLIRTMENVARSELTPIEEAASFGTLRDEFGMTADKIAKKVGRSIGQVKRRLSLLRMPADMQKAIHKGLIKVSVAEELWACRDEGHRSYLLDLCIEHGAKTGVVRTWVKDYEKSQRQPGSGNERGGDEVSPMETRTNYMACEICDTPVDITKLVHLGICTECNKKLRSALVE